jgi:branched-chain amino acid transport system permease protein
VGSTLERRIWPLLPLAALVTAVAFIGSGLSPSSQLDVTTGLVQLGVVIGLYTFVGLSGVFSFGHVAFVAVGAYLAGILAVPQSFKRVLYTDLPGFLADVELSPLLAIFIGGFGAALVGLALAPALGRLAGLSASLATFAVLVIVHDVARNYEPVTRGTRGMLGVPRETTVWVALVWALALLTMAHAFQRSRFGLQLRAAREDPIAAQAVGVFVGRLRGVALVLSAFMVGLAGGVYGQLLGSFNPEVFYLDLTFLTIAMLVIGGVNSLSGAVIGTLAVTGISEILRELEATLGRPGLTEVGFAVLAISILILRPSGITGGRELPLPGIVARAFAPLGSRLG